MRTSSARITAARAATSASNTSVPRVLSDSTLLVDSLSAGDGVGAISGVVILLTLVAAFKTPQKRKGKKDNRSLNEKKKAQKAETVQERMSAFGVVVSGLAPVFTPSAVTDALHCVYRVPECPENAFVVVFLTGAVPFPETHVAKLFLAFAPSGEQSKSPQAVSWSPLGVVSASKPSAMFKVSNEGKRTQDLLVGISVEGVNPFTGTGPSPAPFAQRPGAAEGSAATPAPAVNKRTVAMRITNDFMVFAERYVAEHPNALQASREVIPTTVVREWLNRATAVSSSTQ